MIFSREIKSEYLKGFTKAEISHLKLIARCDDCKCDASIPYERVSFDNKDSFVNLTGNKRISDVEFKYRLNQLKMKDPEYRYAYFARSKIGDEKIVKLAEAIPKDSPCVSFHLSETDMGEKGAIALTKALSQNTVTYLDISRNPIGDKGATAIAKAIETAPWYKLKMKETDMSINMFVPLNAALAKAYSQGDIKHRTPLRTFEASFKAPKGQKNDYYDGYAQTLARTANGPTMEEKESLSKLIKRGGR